MTLLRESGKARDAEFLVQECNDNREYNSRIGEVQKLSGYILAFSSQFNKLYLSHSMLGNQLFFTLDCNHQYHETFGKNIHIITSHKHAISKVVNDAEQLDGLPICNKYHK